MWFLLIQIFLLLVLAAVLGALAAYWWMKNNYEDVTETHAQLLAGLGGREGTRADALTREDLETGLANLSSRIAEGRPPVDLSPVEHRLEGIEKALAGLSLSAPDTDLPPVAERLQTIEEGLSSVVRAVSALRNTDLRPVEETLDAISGGIERLRQPDLEPVAVKLSALSTAIDEARAPDLAPIGDRLERIESAVAAIGAPAVDLTPIHRSLARLEAAIANFRFPDTDLSAVSEQLGSLEKTVIEYGDRVRSAGKSDFERISASLSELSAAVGALRSPDLDPVVERIARVERAVAANRPEPSDFTPIEKRLDGVDASLRAIPQPDLAPLVDAMLAIDSRMDLAALENRLTSIEYGLAALHDMLRTRQVAAEGRGEDPRRDAAARLSAPNRNAAAPRQEAGPPAPAPSRPARPIDPINPYRRAGDEANLLQRPAFGGADDLTRIDGVGPMLRKMLNDIGVFYFWQMAEWTPEETAYVDSRLKHFQGRIDRDDWVNQARRLAVLPSSAKRPFDDRERV